MELREDALKVMNHITQPQFFLQALSQSLGNPNLCWTNLCVLGYSSLQFRLFNWSKLLPSFILTDLQLSRFNTFSHLEENGSQFFWLCLHTSFSINSVNTPTFYSCFLVKIVMLSHTAHLAVETTLFFYYLLKFFHNINFCWYFYFID